MVTAFTVDGDIEYLEYILEKDVVKNEEYEQH